MDCRKEHVLSVSNFDTKTFHIKIKVQIDFQLNSSMQLLQKIHNHMQGIMYTIWPVHKEWIPL